MAFYTEKSQIIFPQGGGGTPGTPGAPGADGDSSGGGDGDVFILQSPNGGGTETPGPIGPPGMDGDSSDGNNGVEYYLIPSPVPSNLTIYDVTTLTGWTVTQGDGSVTDAGSYIEFNTPALTSSLAARPRIARAIPTSPSAFDIRARIQITSGDNSIITRVNLGIGATDICASGWANGVALSMYSDGTLEWAINGAYNASATAGPNNAQRTGGNLWLRLVSDNGIVSMWWGVGVGGEQPTTWNAIIGQLAAEFAAITTWSTASTTATTFAFISCTISALLATPWTVDLLDVRSYNLSP